MGKDTVQEDYLEQKRSMISDRLRQEDEDKRMQALVSSPVRKGDDGPVVFIGRQEHEDEILRQHYLITKMRGKDDIRPTIPRDNPNLMKQ